jgi:hypothetical protein
VIAFPAPLHLNDHVQFDSPHLTGSGPATDEGLK